jgi:hypothetical protein
LTDFDAGNSLSVDRLWGGWLTWPVFLRSWEVVMPKAEYETPELIDAGLFEEITEGGANGSVLDASFSAGTPVSDLTFS